MIKLIDILNDKITVNDPSKKADLFNVINKYKNKLAKQFNLDVNSLTVSGGDEGEPVIITDDNEMNQVDFVKKEDWELNKGFYTNNQETGDIVLDGIDIIYIKNL